MTEYFNMWRNYFNFTDRTDRKGFWMAILFDVIATIGVYLISGFFNSNIPDFIYSAAVLIPVIAMVVRRLRDIGKPWPWVFLLCIPGIGAVVILVMMCFNSIPDNGIRKV